MALAESILSQLNGLVGEIYAFFRREDEEDRGAFYLFGCCYTFGNTNRICMISLVRSVF